MDDFSFEREFILSTDLFTSFGNPAIQVDDLEHDSATNREERETQLLQELEDITSTLERTEYDEDLATTKNGVGDIESEGTVPELRQILTELESRGNSQRDQQQIAYETLGCFKDSQVDPRPLPELLADLTNEVDWYDPNKVIKKCAKLATDKGYTVFALQLYGQCRSGKHAAKTYDGDGLSSGCSVGLGGREENLVFKIIPHECQNYIALTSINRSSTFDEPLGLCDDKLQPAWYRFLGPAGYRMPTSCVPVRHCGTHAPGWLNDPHPAVHEGAVSRDVCFHWRSCCSWRNSVLVRNCGAFFVYFLSPTMTCNLGYCGNGEETTTSSPATQTTTGQKETTTWPSTTETSTTSASITSTTLVTSSSPTFPTTPATPLECLRYKFLNESTRAITYSSKNRQALCDNRLPKAWYRFGGRAGDKMPEHCVDKLSCGTHAPGWLSRNHPSVADGIVEATVCFHWGSNCCFWSLHIKFELPRICMIPLPFKECSRYRIISDADRSQTYKYTNVQDAKPICDRRLPKAWYRFTGLAGDKMSHQCVSPYHCGTHAPGWLLGAHPEVSDGVVTRTVCFSWRNKCCRWRSQISVRNCGDFYVYKLQRAPKCKLRYCSVGKPGSTTTPRPTMNPNPTTVAAKRPFIVLCFPQRIPSRDEAFPYKCNYKRLDSVENVLNNFQRLQKRRGVVEKRGQAYPPFMVMCLIDSMHVFIPRRHLPRSVDPWRLRLDDVQCGVVQMNDEHVMLKTPLDGCGTTRRTYEKSISFHNKVVTPSGMKFLDLPFQCSYKVLASAKELSRLEPFLSREELGPNQGPSSIPLEK
ncbi:Pancreatic secretory granule membrane major glycoprotein GP2 [Stylophora pistillata]|uniref:Pancreatic secretory granule membrane major glycoprotein GP2 n=1 Tax=Stylophora pistillata TaxID=50429 RepID=A0A2B4SHC6_STYPI|nr:Pancreatic secretory granule membrane major glycoprotein GP2 [Stylophora pistillata]